eukprot:5523002-Pyramimonas_sp.AAC.1
MAAGRDPKHSGLWYSRCAIGDASGESPPRPAFGSPCVMKCAAGVRPCWWSGCYPSSWGHHWGNPGAGPS